MSVIINMVIKMLIINNVKVPLDCTNYKTAISALERYKSVQIEILPIQTVDQLMLDQFHHLLFYMTRSSQSETYVFLKVL